MAVGGNLVADAFGVVAMVAMTPLITIQILGMVYQLKQQKSGEQALRLPVDGGLHFGAWMRMPSLNCRSVAMSELYMMVTITNLS